MLIRAGMAAVTGHAGCDRVDEYDLCPCRHGLREPVSCLLRCRTFITQRLSLCLALRSLLKPLRKEHAPPWETAQGELARMVLRFGLAPSRYLGVTK